MKIDSLLKWWYKGDDLTELVKSYRSKKKDKSLDLSKNTIDAKVDKILQKYFSETSFQDSRKRAIKSTLKEIVRNEKTCLIAKAVQRIDKSPKKDKRKLLVELRKYKKLNRLTEKELKLTISKCDSIIEKLSSEGIFKIEEFENGKKRNLIFDKKSDRLTEVSKIINKEFENAKRNEKTCLIAKTVQRIDKSPKKDKRKLLVALQKCKSLNRLTEKELKLTISKCDSIIEKLFNEGIFKIEEFENGKKRNLIFDKKSDRLSEVSKIINKEFENAKDEIEFENAIKNDLAIKFIIQCVNDDPNVLGSLDNTDKKVLHLATKKLLNENEEKIEDAELARLYFNFFRLKVNENAGKFAHDYNVFIKKNDNHDFSPDLRIMHEESKHFFSGIIDFIKNIFNESFVDSDEYIKNDIFRFCDCQYALSSSDSDDRIDCSNF
jgi:hypothetical protein